MLTPDEVVSTVRDLWKRHQDELVQHDRVYDYLRGRRGRPQVPEGANAELKELARLAVKNIMRPVVSSFASPLCVVGFRAPTETANGPVWELWQQYRLDARQAGVHRSTVGYGSAYAVGLKDEVRLRSPRQLIAVYSDPHVDAWPVFALETWIDRSEAKPVRRGKLYDDECEYPVDLGGAGLSRSVTDDDVARRATVRPVYDEADAEAHGSDVCPVVRFVNDRDTEDVVLGEVEPLIVQQQTINAVNFDRLVVSRFGAFPQKYVIGWSAADSAELARVSAARLMSFDDAPADVKVGSFTQADVGGYNSILADLAIDAAIDAQTTLSAFRGSFDNLAADTIALTEAPYQRKLGSKRDSIGESWEQLLGLLASYHGIDVPVDAEVVWRDTEARSFAQVVDGIGKLKTAGVPIQALLDDIPGWSQQRIDAAKKLVAGNEDLARILKELSGGADPSRS